MVFYKLISCPDLPCYCYIGILPCPALFSHCHFAFSQNFFALKINFFIDNAGNTDIMGLNRNKKFFSKKFIFSLTHSKLACNMKSKTINKTEVIKMKKLIGIIIFIAAIYGIFFFQIAELVQKIN